MSRNLRVMRVDTMAIPSDGKPVAVEGGGTYTPGPGVVGRVTLGPRAAKGYRKGGRRRKSVKARNG